MREVELNTRTSDHCSVHYAMVESAHYESFEPSEDSHDYNPEKVK